MTSLEWIFVAEYLALFVLRGWFVRGHRHKKPAVQLLDGTERVLMALVFVGFMLVPPIYLFTPLFDFSDYRRPEWLGWVGAGVAVATVWLFWRSHADLGKNWSPTIEIFEHHTLVDRGVYRRLRHPMYASIWLWGISQALLLPNWIAGLSGLAAFAPMYFLRVPREERMMLGAFGELYRAYMARTGRIVPPLLGMRSPR